MKTHTEERECGRVLAPAYNIWTIHNPFYLFDTLGKSEKINWPLRSQKDGSIFSNAFITISHLISSDFEYDGGERASVYEINSIPFFAFPNTFRTQIK